MYLFLKHFHSVNRWAVVALIIASLFWAFKNLHSEKKFRLFSITVIVTHLQLLGGLILYFISPMVIFSSESMSNTVTRFYLVEHIGLMLVSVTLITLGGRAYRKFNFTAKAYRKLIILFSIGFLLMLVAIPWPFMNLNGSWF